MNDAHAHWINEIGWYITGYEFTDVDMLGSAWVVDHDRATVEIRKGLDRSEHPTAVLMALSQALMGSIPAFPGERPPQPQLEVVDSPEDGEGQ